MRKIFSKILEENLILNKKNFLITGDLGFNVLDNIKENFKENFLNIGICEQSMLSFSAGLSKHYKNVFVYSIANFNTFRALEQIRNDICYQDNKVIIVSVGTGFAYGKLGYTHYGIEDIGIINTLPNIHIYNPLDEDQFRLIFNKILKINKPVYLRLNRDSGVKFKRTNKLNSSGFDKINYKPKNKITILSYGYSTSLAYQYIKKENLDEKINIIDCYQLKPFNTKEILKLIKNSHKIIILEEHRPETGLFGIFSYNCIDKINEKKIFSIGLNNESFSRYGDHDFMLNKYLNFEEKIKKYI